MRSKVYNLSFFDVENFTPFTIDRYHFEPIVDMQPRRGKRTESQGMYLNAEVTYSEPDNDSVIYHDVKILGDETPGFIHDVLALISIAIGHHVVLESDREYSRFPNSMGNNIRSLVDRSAEIPSLLNPSIDCLRNIDWQSTYDFGFHLRIFYANSSVKHLELMYLSDVTIWEFIYYCRNRNKTYDKMTKTKLSYKIAALVSSLLLKGDVDYTRTNDHFRIFSDLRNQLSHNGKLPIQNPRSPAYEKTFEFCEKHVMLFRIMTHVLIFSTLGVDLSKRLFERNDFQTLLRKGFIG